MTDKCPSCGKDWTDHLGIQGTCQRLQKALSTLKVIRTLASCDKDFGTLDADDVLKLCDKTLKEVE